MKPLVSHIPDSYATPCSQMERHAARFIHLVQKVDNCGIISTHTAPGTRPAAVLFLNNKCCTINQLLTKNSLL
jgi:hypothetical protein